MKLKLCWCRVAIAVSLSLSLFAGACVAPGDEAEQADETVGEATSELSLSSWSMASTSTASAYRSGQVATLNGTTYMVSSGYCGAWSCGGSGEADDLYWSRFTATGRTGGVRIGTQKSAHKVNLAPFNGFLYMVHTGVSDVTQTWISRFNPSTQQWSANFQIPYPSFAGPPAIVAHNGVLRFIGTRAGTFQMWTATMTTGEIFSSMTDIPNHQSASRPSAAVFNGLVYTAHRHGQTGEIVIGSFNGSTWTPQSYILAAGGSPIRGLEPVLATHDGFLHLIHRRPETEHVWWTYFNGCSWPGEITLNNLQSSYDPSLTQGGPGLMLLTTSNLTWNGIIESRSIWLQKFNDPVNPFPMPPVCGIFFP